jgi:hypothetical protein
MVDPITKANHAKRLLEDEVLLEAFAQVEKDIFDEWRMSATADYSARADMFLTLKGLERLKARLQAILDDGLVAQSRS